MSRKRAFLSTLASGLAALAPAYAQAAPAHGDPLYIVVNKGSDATTPRPVTLPLNKAIVVDLPSEARDVLLSNPGIADSVVRTARRVFIIGRAIGQTNAFFFDAEGRQIANLEIRVEPDVTPLNEMLARFAPNQSVKAEAVSGSLVLSGSVRSAADADRVMQIATKYLATLGAFASGEKPQITNLLHVEGKEQVLVKVRVVEMSRSLIKQLGIDLSANLTTLISEDLTLDGGLFNDFPIQGQQLGGLFGTASYNNGGNQVDANIKAFERAGLVRILAEPNLTAISGESARFLAGGEFPVPVAATDDRITIEFKPFGVGLAFTPIVLSEGMISLKLSTEVSELTSEGSIKVSDFNINALQVRRAETTVEMPSGSALVMAGLIHERTRQAMESVPGSGDLPVLGSLLRSRDFLHNETELVIIVTPYLVEPTDPDKLKTPLDGYANPSDLAAFLSGRLNAVYRGGSQDDGRRLQGPAGHVLK